MFTEVLVRELKALGEALEERDGELGALTERLEVAFSDSKDERTRHVSVCVKKNENLC